MIIFDVYKPNHITSVIVTYNQKKKQLVQLIAQCVYQMDSSIEITT